MLAGHPAPEVAQGGGTRAVGGVKGVAGADVGRGFDHVKLSIWISVSCLWPICSL